VRIASASCVWPLPYGARVVFEAVLLSMVRRNLVVSRYNEFSVFFPEEHA
jgi:hypothetical protein